MIAKYSIHTVYDWLLWWLTATHSPQNIRFIRAGAVPEHNPRKEKYSSSSCNSRFSNRDGDKEANLTECSFKIVICKNDIWTGHNKMNKIFFLQCSGIFKLFFSMRDEWRTSSWDEFVRGTEWNVHCYLITYTLSSSYYHLSFQMPSEDLKHPAHVIWTTIMTFKVLFVNFGAWHHSFIYFAWKSSLNILLNISFVFHRKKDAELPCSFIMT